MLWLRCRLATVALIRPLAWELPYAMGAGLKIGKKKNYVGKEQVEIMVESQPSIRHRYKNLAKRSESIL